VLDLNTEFPIDSAISYLNHAAVAPWPQRTARAVTGFAQENTDQGAMEYPRWMQKEQLLRDQLVSLLNAEHTDAIALVKNTSEALSFVAHGLSWRPGDNVVISNLEFPSNRIVWESLARYGVEVIEADISEGSPEQRILEATNEHTRLISISSVQYASGLKLNLKPIGEFCRRKEILFCVDAIQSVGAHQFDVQDNYVDFAMADGHKWMLGPEGLGFFYLNPTIMDRLKLHQFGWHMVERQGDYDRREWDIASSARRFECGSPNMLAIHALSASLSLLLEVGMESVELALEQIVGYAIERIRELPKARILSTTDPIQRAGIVTFSIDDTNMSKLHQSLMTNRVICAHRGGGIRFSPHFYSSTETIDRAIDVLREKL